MVRSRMRIGSLGLSRSTPLRNLLWDGVENIFLIVLGDWAY